MTSMKILRLSNRYQRGSGWGNVFGRISSFLRPILSSVAKAGKPVVQQAMKRLANESIKTGANIISDIAEGQNVRQAIKERGKQGLKSGKNIVLDEVQKGINRQVGGKKQLNTNRKRKHPGHSGGKKSHCQKGGKKQKKFSKKRKKQKNKKSNFFPKRGHFF